MSIALRLDFATSGDYSVLARLPAEQRTSFLVLTEGASAMSLGQYGHLLMPFSDAVMLSHSWCRLLFD